MITYVSMNTRLVKIYTVQFRGAERSKMVKGRRGVRVCAYHGLQTRYSCWKDKCVFASLHMCRKQEGSVKILLFFF